MLLVDTSVLVDVLHDDPQWPNWSIGQLRAIASDCERSRARASIHQLAINLVIYAKMSLSFSTLEGLYSAKSTLALEPHEMSRPALFLAPKACAQHRKRGGSKQQVLPDFFIGAHAAVEG